MLPPDIQIMTNFVANLNNLRMSWKKILTLKDKFSYRQKVGLLLVMGTKRNVYEGWRVVEA